MNDPTTSRIEAAADDAGVHWRPQTGFSHTIDTFEALDRLNATGGIAVAMHPLSRMPIRFAFAGSQTERLSIWETRAKSGFRATPQFTADLLSIRFISGGSVTRENLDRAAITAGFDQGLLTTFETMDQETIAPDSATITATLPHEAVTHAARSLDDRQGTRPPAFQPIVAVNTVGLRLMRQNMRRLRKRLACAADHIDMLTPLMEEILVYQLLSAWPSADGRLEIRQTDATSSAVRRAIDFIDANLSNPMKIAEIAEAAGQSVRRLQTGFRQRLDMTIIDYLIGRRLDRVHVALQVDDGRSVKDIAMQWGFVHMSDFGQRFKRRFGVPPSSLRRTR